MKKILFISNIARKVNTFSLASISAARSFDFSFHMAANWSTATKEQIESDQNEYNVKIHNIDLERSPFSKANITAYRQLVALIQKERIDYIHCNTPVGGLLGRLASKKCKVKKIIYQVHGFHFYKGAPKLNWLLYYPIEKWLARYTDAIITINKEDYARAKRFKLRKNGQVFYVPGVGIRTEEFSAATDKRNDFINENNLSEDSVLLISAGDLNKNKNNAVIIRAIAKLNNRRIHYFLCGVGNEKENLALLADALGVGEQIHFLGYRKDIKELLKSADIFVMPSFREGLSRSMMEAMASGLPCIASKIRGNVDLVEDGVNGFLRKPTDVDGFSAAILRIADDAALQETMRKNNLEKIQSFDISVVAEEIRTIYKEVLSEK